MNKFRSFLNKKIILLLLAFGGVSLAANVAEDYFEISKNIEVFSDVYKHVNLYYSDETKPGELMKIGIDAMLKSLDPYTVYIPESKMEDYRIMNTGQYGGIGASVRTVDEQVVITEPYEGFAAQKAGLQAGDVVKEVDGKNIEDLSREDLSELFKGQAGTDISIMIERYGQEKEFQMQREDVKIPNVPYYGIVKDKTGYIKLNKFTATASADIKSAYQEMEKEGMDKLILDLRGNTGGLLREAVNIVNFFVPKGTEIVSTKGRLEDWEKTYKAINSPLTTTMPVAVLVGPVSASASEVVSGALQDLDRAVIIGSETYGKGLVQQTKDIAYNSKVKLTVAKYYTPSGRCIQKLDYFNKTDGVTEEVPDSLISKFKTVAGREVFDGRGIKPDVEIEEENMGPVVVGLFSDDHIFHYATKYRQEHSEIGDPVSFKISDQDFQDFKNWARNRDVQYSSESEAILEELMAVSKEEQYYDMAKSELDALASKYKPDVSKDIDIFEDQIRSILTSEIVGRYYFQKGRIKNILHDDELMEAAYENLMPSKYNSILKK